MKVLSRFVLVLVFWSIAIYGRAQANTSDNFSLQKTTEIPGSKLHAGSYKLAVLDSLADRIVMQVNGTDGKTQALLLGVSANLSGPSGEPVFWDAKEQGRHALRGFVFHDGRSVEFVYPKADAVALAKSNHSSVVAVDPASEGRPELGKLSSRDMQMVNLWLLTPTRVSGQDGLDAKHYEPSGTNVAQRVTAQSAPTSASPVQVAAATPAPQTRSSVSSASPAPRATRPALQATSVPSHASSKSAPAKNLRASNDVPQSIKRLPQTGSSLPLWFLLAGASLSGAAVLRTRRVAQAGV